MSNDAPPPDQQPVPPGPVPAGRGCDRLATGFFGGGFAGCILAFLYEATLPRVGGLGDLYRFFALLTALLILVPLGAVVGTLIAWASAGPPRKGKP